MDKFVTLAKTVSKRGYVGLITQVLDSLHVYVFGELLNALENVPEEYRQYRELYLVFTYGTYLEYRAKRDELPELSEKQMKKLKKLSIVHVVNRCSSKVVPYDQLLKALDCNDVAEMEALVMSCMYSKLLIGTLNQREQNLKVRWVMARDVPESETESIIQKLQDWCTLADEVTCSIHQSVANVKGQVEQDQKTHDEKQKQIQKIADALPATQEHAAFMEEGTMDGYAMQPNARFADRKRGKRQHLI